MSIRSYLDPDLQQVFDRENRAYWRDISLILAGGAILLALACWALVLVGI